MPKFKVLIGVRFNMLIVIKDAPKAGKNRMVICLCDCGKETLVQAGHLRNGHTKSCGCQSCLLGTHNMRNSKEYRAYYGMLDRCYNPNVDSFHLYGERGITVCPRWLESFENFFEDMGKSPSSDHSLDRYPNNDTGNYEPINCRWATEGQQSRNKRTNRVLEYNGKSMILQDWAYYFKVTSSAVFRMINKNGFEYTYNYYTLKNAK